MASKHKKRCSKSLDMMKMQIKNRMICPTSDLTRMPINQEER